MATKTKDLDIPTYRTALKSMDVDALRSELRAIDARRVAVRRELDAIEDASTGTWDRLFEAKEDLMHRHDLIGDELTRRGH